MVDVGPLLGLNFEGNIHALYVHDLPFRKTSM